MVKAIRVIFGLSVLAAILASTALGQQRTYVSFFGNDGNPCSRAAPCRYFAQAVSKTAAGGEVIALDSANYRPVTITKSISLVSSPGVFADIGVENGDGIDINAGPSDVVVLRGVTVTNDGSNGSGIVFNTGAKLHVESCVVTGFNSIQSTGTGVESFTGNLEVKDSIMRGNVVGISISSVSSTAFAAIDHVRLEGNSGAGLLAGGGSQVTVRNSLASDNRGNGPAYGFVAAAIFERAIARLDIDNCVASNNASGIVANSSARSGLAIVTVRSTTASGNTERGFGASSLVGTARLNVENCGASDNGTDGISAEAGGTGITTVRVSNSAVTDNGAHGLANYGGANSSLLSRGNNTVQDNALDTFGTIGAYSAK